MNKNNTKSYNRCFSKKNKKFVNRKIKWSFCKVRWIKNNWKSKKYKN